MDFDDVQYNAISQQRKILYAIVSGYPAGIGDSELKREYSKIQSEQKEVVSVSNVSTALYDIKGTLVDFRTVSGIRVFSVLRQRAPLSLIHPLIVPSVDGPLHLVRPVSVVDCNSFCVYLVKEEDNCLKYTQKIHEECCTKRLRLFDVPKWLVHVGDCYVAYSAKYSFFLRVKVVKCFEAAETVMCFLVDLGRYDSFRMCDLKVAPAIGAYFHHTLKTVKHFKQHAYAIRCFINVAKKPFGGFPNSRTGLHLALCGHEEFRNVKLKLRFLAYDYDSDAFMVDIFSENGETSKLEDAVRDDSAILEKDKFYAMRLDADFDGNAFETENDGRERFVDFVGDCEQAFASMKVH